MDTAPDQHTHPSQGSAKARRPARPPADEDARRERLEQFHSRLSEQVLSLTSSTAWTDWLRTAARFHSYSFRNTVSIWSQRPEASQVAGYRVWQAIGRQVRKGERSIEILAPVTRRVEDDDAEAGAGAGTGGGVSRPRGAAKEPGMLPPPRKVVGYRIAHVFDISQTELGAGAVDVVGAVEPTLLTGDAPAQLWDGLARQVREAGYDLVVEPLAGGANGRTHFTDRVVTVIPTLEPAQRVKTLGHELAHATLHEPGETAAQPSSSLVVCRGRIEVEAESVAFLVTSAHGMDASAYSFTYVAGWAQQAGGDIEATLADTATRVLGAAHRILDRLDRDNPTPLPVAEDAVPFELSGPLRTPSDLIPPTDRSRHPIPSPGAADIAQAHRGVGR